MKLKVYSFYSRIISFCLIVLGFGSCSNDDDLVVEYGTPSAKYKVSGKVVSEDTKQPIKGIRVVMIENIDESKFPYIQGDTVYTNAEGKFDTGELLHFPHNKFKIKIQDIDGANNGEFEDKEQIIEFKSSDYIGRDRWYEGEAQKDMGTIELTPKDTQE